MEINNGCGKRITKYLASIAVSLVLFLLIIPTLGLLSLVFRMIDYQVPELMCQDQFNS